MDWTAPFALLRIGDHAVYAEQDVTTISGESSESLGAIDARLDTLAEDLVQDLPFSRSYRVDCSCATNEPLSCGILFAGSPLAPIHQLRPCSLLSEGRIISLAKRKLDLDLGMLVAAERFTTGANAHNLRGLANAYVLACENDQPSIAEQYRTRLLRELDRSVRGRAAAFRACMLHVA